MPIRQSKGSGVALNTDVQNAVSGSGTAAYSFKSEVLTDAKAPTNCVFFSSDHLDTDSQPKLCRKNSAGTVAVLG